MNREYRLTIFFMNREPEFVIVNSNSGMNAIMKAGLTYESQEDDEITQIKITYIEPMVKQTHHIADLVSDTLYIDSKPCNEHYMLIN